MLKLKKKSATEVSDAATAAEVAATVEQIAPKTEKPKKKKKKKKWVKPLIILIILAALAYATYYFLFTETPAVALTSEVSHGSLATTLEGTGTTIPVDSETYTTASNSSIEEIFISAGQTVAIGDPLYFQDDSDVDDLIEEYEDEIIDYEDTMLDYESDYSDALDDIANATITASFSGKIIGLQIEEGDKVNNGTTLFQLVDDSVLETTIYVSYNYEDQVYIGQSVQVSVADQMLLVTGTVSEISYVDYVSDTGARCFAVTVDVPNAGSLTDGMTVAAIIGDSIYPVSTGTLSYANYETVSSEVSSDVLTVNVVDYQTVYAGQVLVQLDTEDLYTALETVVTRMESVQSQIDNLYEKIEEAEESREDYYVYSEIEGMVISVGITTDRDPMTGATAAMIYNMDTMQISANIDELDIDSVYVGMPVDITYSSGTTSQAYEGYISEVSYEATNSSGVAYFPIVIEIPSNGGLSAGVNVSYSIAIGDEAEGTLVPIAALKSVTDGTAVFIQGTDTTGEALVLDEGIVPDGFYAMSVTVLSVNSTYALVSEEIPDGTQVFTSYQTTDPGGGDTTSDTGTDDMSSMMGMEMMSGMDMNMNMSSNMSSGMSSSGPGGR